MKETNINLQQSSLRVVNMLSEVGYINEKEKAELLYNVKTGNRAAYSRLKELLIQFADVLGRIS